MRTVPDIKMALPGPKAAAIVARDNKYVSPSYTRFHLDVMRSLAHGDRGPISVRHESTLTA